MEANDSISPYSVIRPEISQIRFEAIAFWFWAISVTKPVWIFLFFQDNALLGTAAGGVCSLFFFVLVIPHVILHGMPKQVITWPRTAKILAAYLLWTTATIFWTQGSSKLVAASYDAVLLMDVILVGLLMLLGDTDRVALRSLHGIAFGSAAFAVAVLCLAGITVDNRLGNSEFLHPNVIGKQMAFASLCSIFFIMKSHRSLLVTLCWSGVSVILTITLLLSLSKTSIAAFGIALPAVLFGGKASKVKLILISLMILTLLYLSLSRLSDYLEQYVYTTQQGQALETASGRVVVWAETIEMIRKNPWLGHGLMSFRDAGPQVASERLVTAHDEYLHQWFSYGIVGLILAVLIYLSFLSLVRRARRTKTAELEGCLGMGLLVFSLVRGLPEAEAMGLVFPLPLLLLMVLWLTNAIGKNSKEANYEQAGAGIN